MDTAVTANTNPLLFLWAAYALIFLANIAYIVFLVSRWKRLNGPRS